jgi:hypothetical protein
VLFKCLNIILIEALFVIIPQWELRLTEVWTNKFGILFSNKIIAILMHTITCMYLETLYYENHILIILLIEMSRIGNP